MATSLPSHSYASPITVRSFTPTSAVSMLQPSEPDAPDWYALIAKQHPPLQSDHVVRALASIWQSSPASEYFESVSTIVENTLVPSSLDEHASHEMLVAELADEIVSGYRMYGWITACMAGPSSLLEVGSSSLDRPRSIDSQGRTLRTCPTPSKNWEAQEPSPTLPRARAHAPPPPASKLSATAAEFTPSWLLPQDASSATTMSASTLDMPTMMWSPAGHSTLAFSASDSLGVGANWPSADADTPSVSGVAGQMQAHMSLDTSTGIGAGTMTASQPRMEMDEATAAQLQAQVDIGSKYVEELLEILSELADYQLKDLDKLPDARLKTALQAMLGYIAPDVMKTQVCKFYMQGQCKRLDCWYSHDVSSMPCRYFERGWCRAGESCPYMHDEAGQAIATTMPYLRNLIAHGRQALLKELNREDDLAATQQPAFVVCDEDFPELVPSTKGKGSRSSGHGSGSGSARKPLAGPALKPPKLHRAPDLTQGVEWNTARQLKWQQLLKLYPHVWEEDAFSAFKACSFDVDKTVRVMSTKFGKPHKAVVKQAAYSPKQTRKKKRNSKHTGDSVPDVAWVTTGQEVGKLYMQHRGEAIDLAVQRNKLFQRATDAYLRGDAKLARDLSRQGKELDQQMTSAHKAAAAALFATRNKMMPKENMVDLHGLHVKEALSYLEVFMEKMEETSNHECFVITGTGHHSDHKHLGQNNVARLLPTVRQYLTRYGYSFQDASTDGRGGMLRVQLSTS
eukprot:m.12694 g.12694  ORF g.12694 m.12694 type:complete len:739 (-) comp5857_c0_seq1:168-2384(-)